MDTCFGLLKFGGAGHTAAIYAKNDTRIREYGMRMPAMRVLVNTPAPQGSTGITTNVFPSMTLGCGAMAGNSTSDNVGPAAPDQHQAPGLHRAHRRSRPSKCRWITTRRRTARCPPAAGAGQSIARPSSPPWSATWLRAASRYRRRRQAPPAGASSCGCSTPAPHTHRQQSVVASVAAEVVDRFLARRGAVPAVAGGPQKSGGYS